MAEAKVNQLEEYLKTLIKQELETHDLQLKEKDAKAIVSTMIDEVDKLASNRVKQHFIEIAEYIIQKFKNKEGD